MRLVLLMSRTSPWARAVAIQLSEKGHIVHVVDFDNFLPQMDYHSGLEDINDEIDAFHETVAGVHILKSMFSSNLRYFTSIPQLRRILKSCDADALLATKGGGYGTMAYLSGFKRYAVYTVGSDVLLPVGIKRKLAKIMLNSAKLVLANGGYLASKAHELSPHANIVPLLLGVDIMKFLPGTPPQEPVRIICTRGFTPIYNNEYLVRSLAFLPSSLPDFRVTFVSPGPLLEQVRALADEHLPGPIRSKVEFLGGISSELLIEKLRSSHVYVSLSRSDGTSISLLEALACGLFPVLSDIPQNREWIDPDANNGILVPLDQPQALADALARAILGRELRGQAQGFNRRLILERADSQKNTALLISHLEAMLHPNASRMCSYVD